MKRNKEIKIRLTENELLSLNQKTKKTSLSREAYCRKILGGATVKEAPPVDVAMLLRTMRNAAYKLDHSLSEKERTQYGEVVAEIREATKLIVDTYSNRIR